MPDFTQLHPASVHALKDCEALSSAMALPEQTGGRPGNASSDHFAISARPSMAPQGRSQKWHKAKQESHTDCAASAKTVDQKFRELRASVEWLKASIATAGENERQLRASAQQLRADAELEESETKKLAKELKREVRLSKYCRAIVHRDEAADMLQALQIDGRRRALAHVGICSSATAPDGTPCRHRITTLVQNWTSTCWTVLIEPQRRDIIRCFGDRFVGFLRADALPVDMANASGPTYTLSIHMRWVDRSILREAIDDLEPEAVREGGRIAYLSFFGLLGYFQWEDEVKRVDDMLVKTESEIHRF